MGLSSFASKTVEDVVAANPETFFQLYWSGSRHQVRQRTDRARAAGAVGLIVGSGLLRALHAGGHIFARADPVRLEERLRIGRDHFFQRLSGDRTQPHRCPPCCRRTGDGHFTFGIHRLRPGRRDHHRKRQGCPITDVASSRLAAVHAWQKAPPRAARTRVPRRPRHCRRQSTLVPSRPPMRRTHPWAAGASPGAVPLPPIEPTIGHCELFYPAALRCVSTDYGT